MKRTLVLLLLLLALPMARTQLIRRIRCQMPQYAYEDLCHLSESELRALL